MGKTRQGGELGLVRNPGEGTTTLPCGLRNADELD
jgi:hypothetical protein